MPARRPTKLRQMSLDGKPAPSKAQPSKQSRSKSSVLERVFTDVILPIKPEFAKLISEREKNHEYRSYQLRSTVERLWLYEVAPISAITYIVHTSKPKTPGQVCDSSGVGNDDFDAGLEKSKFGYPILGLLKLQTPITAQTLKERFGISVPQAYCFATKDLVDGQNLDDTEKLF